MLGEDDIETANRRQEDCNEDDRLPIAVYGLLTTVCTVGAKTFKKRR